VSDKNFENLVHEHGRQVLNTALRVLGDANLANDVHQEVFLAIWRRWPSYNGHTHWPAYLYRATVRKALQTARQANGHRREIPPRRDRDDRRPDGNMRTDELRQKLAIALAKLPAHQAESFVLLRLEGLGTAEVAEILGCSRQTVRVHLHRALKKLSRELKPCLG
jgi:RNA polymerase sigma-19 factor, ECF subfamily